MKILIEKAFLNSENEIVVVSNQGTTTLGETGSIKKVYEQWLSEGNSLSQQYSLKETKNVMLLTVDNEHAEILRNLTGNATIEERDTWQSKALAAQAISDGDANAVQTEMITTEATMSGVEVSELVTKILTKNGAFMKMIGLASGHRSATRAAINAATSLEELNTIAKNARVTAERLVQQFLQAVQDGG